MRLHHIALAILVVAIWGFDFVVIKIGLQEIPPILLCALRFFLAAFPAVFFIKRPAVPVPVVVCFGLVMFPLQFGLLFSGMYVGTTAGLASLVLQVHVFFTILLAVVFFLAEKPSIWQKCWLKTWRQVRCSPTCRSFLVQDLMLAFVDFSLSNGSNAMKNYLLPEDHEMARQLNAIGLILITFDKTIRWLAF